MSQQPNIYAAKDHRAFLRAMVEWKRGQDSKFSLAYFSRKIRLSESYLKLVLLRKRELNLDAAALLARAFGLRALEKAYFLTLILRDQARTPALRNHFHDQLLRIQREGLDYQDKPGLRSVFASSLTWEVFSLIGVAGFQSDARWIAARLRREKVTPEQVREALRKLEELGVIEETPAGWRAKDLVVKHALDLKEVYKVALRRALDLLDSSAYDQESYFDSFCLILSKEEYEQVKEVLEEARIRIGQIARRKEQPKERIAYFNANLFWASV